MESSINILAINTKFKDCLLKSDGCQLGNELISLDAES